MDACMETFVTLIKFMTSITEAASDEGLAWLGQWMSDTNISGVYLCQ